MCAKIQGDTEKLAKVVLGPRSHHVAVMTVWTASRIRFSLHRCQSAWWEGLQRAKGACHALVIRSIWLRILKQGVREKTDKQKQFGAIHGDQNYKSELQGRTATFGAETNF